MNVEDFGVKLKFERIVNISAPKKIRKNSVLYAFIILGFLTWHDNKHAYVISRLIN